MLSSIHYIPDLSVNLSEKEDKGHSYKKLLYKIGVAGFVFINVMTYSLPAYFNGKPLEDQLQSLLSLLSWILVIPVVFYSGNDYFISTYKNIRKKNVSIDLPIAIGILVLFLVSSYEILFAGGQGYCDSLSGLVFFLLIGKWYQGKTYEALSFDRNYKSYFPIAVTKINKQIEESVLLENIDVEDVLIIIDGKGRIDYSFVTGESTPVLKAEGNLIYAGGRQMGEIIKIRVKKRVSQSHLTKLWNQDRTYEKPSDSLKSLSDKISKYFTLIIIAIAVSGFTFWMIRGEVHTAIFVFTAVLIIACPCALALSIPFTFGSTMRIFGKAGLYIKNADVIERLSHVDTIVFDKTGTLTKPNENKIVFTGKEFSQDERDAIYSLAKQSTHPLSIAIVNYFSEANYQSPDHFTEVSGRGIFGKVNNTEVKLGSEEYVTNARGDTIQKASEANNLAKYLKKENLLFNQNPGDKRKFKKQVQL
ncbi:MAG TPA: HAD family hydrolase [Bacteroides sp.]|nr:HAD family hydrolase [Bacteroides sp.]